MTITVHLEDADGGSWHEDINIVGGRNEDEFIDNIIEHMQECFAPGWDAEGQIASGPVKATAMLDIAFIEVRGTNGETVDVF